MNGFITGEDFGFSKYGSEIILETISKRIYDGIQAGTLKCNECSRQTSFDIRYPTSPSSSAAS